MQALVLTEYKKLELASLERPAVGPDDVLVQVRACGICGSDVHGFDGSTGRRIPPLVMGHETAGVVVEVGANVTRTRPGESVTLDSLLSCGKCELCRTGKTNMCAGRRILGVSCNEFRQQGAFAEFVVVPQQAIYSIPADMPFEHAALVEPVSVALHAVARMRIDLGDSAAVVGSGMIGLLVIQALRIAGCDQVIAIDLDDDRLRLAKELGASAAINLKQVDPVAAVLEQTGGRGVDVAMEVVGAAAPLVDGHQLHAARRADWARRKSCGRSAAAAADGGHARTHAGWHARVGGRVSAGDRADCDRGDSRRAADLGDRAARGRAAVVRSALCPRAGVDESCVVSAEFVATC